jgi:hypothetical protein
MFYKRILSILFLVGLLLVTFGISQEIYQNSNSNNISIISEDNYIKPEIDIDSNNITNYDNII